MSGTVSLQADVGNLGSFGLNSFRSVLSALSTDDVQPAAMLQVQDIESLFHANGKFASTVSDELQRSPSHRVDMLSCAVGWRKGDATSMLSQSAEGQAAALLALFLRNTYDHRTAGEILYRFSQRCMPRSRCVASIKQLAEVLTKVCGKIASMGYGNFLAEQVTKLRLVYLQLDKVVPVNFLDDITEETAAELLECMSRAQRETDTRARIRGTMSVGHIMTFLLIMCADDVEISVEGTVIHGGSNKRIFLEVVDTPSDHREITKFQLETAIELKEFSSIISDRNSFPRLKKDIPKAAISILLSYDLFNDRLAKFRLPWDDKDFSLRRLMGKFRVHDLVRDFDDMDSQLLGSWNGSSVLYPTSLARLKMSNSSRFTYQLSDGCFMLNERYFDKLLAGSGAYKYEATPGLGPELVLDKIIPTPAGSSYNIDVTLTESFSAIKIWVRANIHNHITDLDLEAILKNYERLNLSEPCDHPYCTPLDTSRRYIEPHNSSRPYRLPEDVFEAPYDKRDNTSRISLYMVHKDPRLQFLCLGNGKNVWASRILFMRDCCLNCAFQQAVDRQCLSIIAS
ncbi:MAG: hypothetical protein LQ350_007185 [Teloschistes chrysophthalmus]|nr:MAG: hypothetical protein LQ350_007185 [Niorma chrysophthalma]